MAEIGDEWFFVRFSAVLILWITVDNRVDGSNWNVRWSILVYLKFVMENHELRSSNYKEEDSKTIERRGSSNSIDR